jgi:3,4-dihydroxy 2-butanone 4-phosphate synthase / GTP cyclohydrolase II
LQGKIVLVVDDEDRENEGDFIMAAEAATKETLAFIVRHGSGVVCVALEGDECDRLQLPPMVVDNQVRSESSPYICPLLWPLSHDVAAWVVVNNTQDPKKTAYTISVDARVNTTTGISAHDRAVTLRLLASSSSQPSDFSRPGHVFPLRYSEGGVLVRRGHTEASVDLARLAGKRPAGVLCEVVNDDGSMARLPELQVFAKTHGMVLTSIQDLCAYRLETEASSR